MKVFEYKWRPLTCCPDRPSGDGVDTFDAVPTQADHDATYNTTVSASIMRPNVNRNNILYWSQTYMASPS